MGPAPVWSGFESALNPGDQVVKQEEDQDQAHRDVAEDAAVVSAGSDHGGETLHAAAQQARRTQEVWVLKGKKDKRKEKYDEGTFINFNWRKQFLLKQEKYIQILRSCVDVSEGQFTPAAFLMQEHMNFYFII